MSKKEELKKKKPKSAKNEAKEELLALKDQYTRLQAEFANFVRRTEEERNNVYTNGVSDVLGEVVKVLDEFQLALQNANKLDNFKKGMEMIYANIVSAGEEFGLEKIKTVGEVFDPTKHEALLTEESKKQKETILQELQSGYLVKGKVIRTAKVKVAK